MNERSGSLSGVDAFLLVTACAVLSTGLVVWAVQGADVATLVEPLKAAEGVLSVAAFGSSLHVAGRDAAQIDRAIAPYRDRPGLRWARTDANLEDVFISLIATAQDNFASSDPKRAQKTSRRSA